MDVRLNSLVIIAICLPLVGYLYYKLFKLFNSPDGERYRKRRMQGPFVPLNAEDNAEDEARKA